MCPPPLKTKHIYCTWQIKATEPPTTNKQLCNYVPCELYRKYATVGSMVPTRAVHRTSTLGHRSGYYSTWYTAEPKSSTEDTGDTQNTEILYYQILEILEILHTQNTRDTIY